jgi:hypothetical protein
LLLWCLSLPGDLTATTGPGTPKSANLYECVGMMRFTTASRRGQKEQPLCQKG